MILDRNAINTINEKLRLPATGYEQDWEIELADSNRVIEFISFYNNNNLTNAEKIALVALVIASYDDFLNEKEQNDENVWGKLKKILIENSNLFFDLLNYWKVPNENNPVNQFKITPLIRELFS